MTTVDGPDSVAVDAAGNLFVTTMREGVAVFAADGTRWGRDRCTEQALTARSVTPTPAPLYITAESGVYRVRLAQPGLY